MAEPPPDYSKETKLEASRRRETELFMQSIKPIYERDIVIDESTEVPGPHLLLQLWTNLMEYDLGEWYDKYCQDNIIRMDDIERPMLARVVFLTEEVRWNKRCETLCCLYVSCFTKNTDLFVRTCIR